MIALLIDLGESAFWIWASTHRQGGIAVKSDKYIAWRITGSAILIIGIIALIYLFEMPGYILIVGLMVLAGQWTGLLLSRRSRFKDDE